MEDKLPHAIWEGVFTLFGIKVNCATLDDGRRIIEKDSFDAFIKYIESPEFNIETDADEMQNFIAWKEGLQ